MIRFTEAVLLRFGKFENRTLDFTDGIQVIYGGNEAGKSTMQLFFRVMLYGISGNKKDARGMKARERAVPWDAKNAEGILRLSVNGRSLEIHRKFGKTAAGDQTEILDTHTGAVVSEYDPKRLGEQLLGFPESVFEKTFWLHQDGAFFGGADEELTRRLLNLLETGSEEISAEATLKELEKEKRMLKAKDRRSNPGELDQLWTLREEKVRERYQLISDLRQREAEEECLLEEKQKLEKIKAEMERLGKLGEKRNRVLELETQGKKWEQAKKLLELASQAEAREAYLRFKTLEEETVEKAEKLEKSLETLDQTAGIEYDIEKKEKEISLKKKQEKSCNLWFLAGIGLLGVGIGFSGFRIPLWILWMCLLGIPGIALACFGFFRAERVKRSIWSAIEEKNRLLQEWELQKQNRDTIKQEYQELLAPYFCRDATALREGFLQYRQAKMESESYRRTYASIMEGEDPKQLAALVQENADVLAENQDILGLNIDQELQRLQQEQLAVVAAMKEIEGKLSYVFHGARNPADAETEILQIDQEILSLEKKQKALELAASVFEQVYEKRKSDFTPQVNEKVNAFLDTLTGGRYRDIRVSENYQLRLIPDGNHFYEAEYFSRGTYEQMYFALRLALGELLGDGTEPLFLDDFLMAYDDSRAEAALKILKELAGRRQIFLFTCHRRDVEKASELQGTISYLEEE